MFDDACSGMVYHLEEVRELEARHLVELDLHLLQLEMKSDLIEEQLGKRTFNRLTEVLVRVDAEGLSLLSDLTSQFQVRARQDDLQVVLVAYVTRETAVEELHKVIAAVLIDVGCLVSVVR